MVAWYASALFFMLFLLVGLVGPRFRIRSFAALTALLVDVSLRFATTMPILCGLLIAIAFAATVAYLGHKRGNLYSFFETAGFMLEELRNPY